jgi:quercetin dioxygenase-like cupin family protein
MHHISERFAMLSFNFSGTSAKPARHARYGRKTLGALQAAGLSCCFALLSTASQAHEPGLAAPKLVLQEKLSQMPKGDTQEVRVLTAVFGPGDRTVFHSHRSPVTVYVLEGQFNLDLDGRAPVTVSAGQAYVEPPNVKMTGYNRSSTDSLKVVIFYVSDVGTPFLDPVR